MGISIRDFLICNHFLPYSQSPSELCMPFNSRPLLLDCSLLITLYYYSYPKCCGNTLSIFINRKAAFFLMCPIKTYKMQIHIKCKEHTNTT